MSKSVNARKCGKNTRDFEAIPQRLVTGQILVSCFIRVLAVNGNTSSTAQGGGGSFKDRKPIGEVDGCDAWMAEQTH